MKLTAEQLFNATISMIAASMADGTTFDYFNVERIQHFVELAKRTADMIPDDKPKQSKYNTGNLFKNFPWKDGGVTRTEMETWLKMHSGYTSNRAMQTIINNAIAEGVTHKDIHLGKYLPGPDNSHA
jgi:hypothetical protein